MLESLAPLSFNDGAWGPALLNGAGVTLALAVMCIPFGIPLGLAMAVATTSKSRFLRMAATCFSTVFRGLPELLTLLIVYYGCQIGLQKAFASVGYQAEVAIPAFWAGVVAFSLVLTAFSSEIWVAAFKTYGRGQKEAAQALGLPRRTTFFKVTLPQLIRIALPGLSNNWLGLLKDTSLISVIPLVDLMRQTHLAVASTKQPMLFYLAACFIYLFFSAVSGQLFVVAEKYYSRHVRARK